MMADMTWARGQNKPSNRSRLLMGPAIAAAAILLSLVSPDQVFSATDFTHMRATHMGGNWGGNTTGIVPSPYRSALQITATKSVATVNRSPFTNSSGKTITNEIAQFTLSGVTMGTSTLPKAGFWLGRTIETGQAFVQFKPSLDSNLSGITGFSGDVTLTLSALSAGASFDSSALSTLSGTARDLVLAVVNSLPQLIAASTITLNGSATFDQTALAQVGQLTQAAALRDYGPYFQYLRSSNINWIGLTVGMFVDKLSDPTVRVHYRPEVTPLCPTTNATLCLYTFNDADLTAFITAARSSGFHIYLTLALEHSNVNNLVPDPGDGTCKTNNYIVNRSLFGLPSVNNSLTQQSCLNASLWWWNPSNANYAANVATFWSSYQTVAVKYATIAQQTGVELFSLGTETDNLFRTQSTATYPNNFLPQLKQMVAAVRAVYSGAVTYDQFSDSIVHPEWYSGMIQPVFKDLGLDTVGISSYWRLASSPVTNVLSEPQFETLWELVYQTYLIPVQQSNPGKPIIFTEFGFTDDIGSPASWGVNDSASEPQALNGAASPGQLQQANLLQALYKVNQSHNDLAGGVFHWGNSMFIGDTDNLCGKIGFGYYCKAAAQTLSDIYAQQPLASGDYPTAGWWWNPNDVPGRGYSIEVNNDRIFFAAFMYRDDESPVWYIADETYQGNGFSGTLFDVTGTQTLTSTGGGTTTAGSTQIQISGTFSTLGQGVITLSGGPLGSNKKTIPISRFPLDGTSIKLATSTLPPETGWWWNTNERGVGYFIEQQASSIFFANYLYGSDQRNRWYIALNNILPGGSTAETMTGSLLQATGGQTLTSGPLTSVSTAIGQITLQFTSPTAGTITLPNGRVVSITRFTSF